MEEKNFARKNLSSMVSRKSVQEFIESFKENAGKANFGVRYVFDMRKENKERDVDVSSDFELYQVILCNFDKFYKTID